MRTVGALRHAIGVSAPLNPDSQYTKIERQPRRFNPLRVPKKLAAQLPFASKPKNQTKKKQKKKSAKKEVMQKRLKIMEPKDKKIYTLIQQVNSIKNLKQRKRKLARQAARERYQKKKEQEDSVREARQKRKRKAYVACAACLCLCSSATDFGALLALQALRSRWFGRETWLLTVFCVIYFTR